MTPMTPMTPMVGFGEQARESILVNSLVIRPTSRANPTTALFPHDHQNFGKFLSHEKVGASPAPVFRYLQPPLQAIRAVLFSRLKLMNNRKQTR
jgi:hypothetical protein